MSHPSITEALAAEHIRDLRAAARRGELAVLARCCKQPSRITVTRARAAIAAAARPRRGYDTACCPG